jgi:hypothetical protein
MPNVNKLIHLITLSINIDVDGRIILEWILQM